MRSFSATDLQRKLGDVQHSARREPVAIKSRGRDDLVLMSAEHYAWLQAVAQRTHLTEDAPDFIIDAVEKAEMDPKHRHLDELMK